MKGEQPYILEARDISKKFPGVLALDRVNMACRGGEIHALVGENGAGKSTLIKILMGVHPPDDGEIFIEGKKVNIRNAAEARWKYGIDSVFQDTTLVPSLTVAENIFLGRERDFYIRGLISRARLRTKAQEILSEIISDSGIQMPDSDKLIRDLSLAERKIVAIGKAVASHARLIILDEVTALFSMDQIRALFSMLAELKKKNITTIFITHRLKEVFEICDRATVLKDGKFVDTVDVQDISTTDLIRMMTGRESGLVFPPRAKKPPSKSVVTLKDIAKHGILNDVSLHLYEGEILALAGLRGQGQAELLQILYGLQKYDKGEIFIRGEKVTIKKPIDAIQHGVVYLSDDKDEELMFTLSVQKNLALPTLGKRSKMGFVQQRIEKAASEKVVEEFSIKIASLKQEMSNLSGGNKQKVALGRWIPATPEIFLLNEPTQGLDVGVKIEVYQLMRRLADEGRSLIVTLTEMAEILNLPDRILVMGDKRIKTAFSAEEATEEKILQAALG
jgi:ribose transport system ATP-binding protein